jgi:FkbM family methyltransferase
MHPGIDDKLVQWIRSVEHIRLPVGLRILRQFEFRHKLGILETIYGGALERLGVCWVTTSNGLAWKLDMANPTHRWIVYGKYEGPAFIDWASAHVPANGVIVDSGANVGQMLLHLAKFVPHGKVLAYEPHPEAREWLEECLAQNAELQVSVLPFALGARAADLYLAPKGTPEHHGARSQVSDSAGIPIRVARLDEELARLGIESADLWKLDVEGHELAALEGADALLKAHAIRAIYAELGFGHGEAIVAYLRERGYRCGLFDRSGRLRPLRDLPEHTNGLFLPEEVPLE